MRCRTLAHVVGGPRVELRFERAHMSLHRSGTPPEPGVQVQLQEVVPAGAPSTLTRSAVDG